MAEMAEVPKADPEFWGKSLDEKKAAFDTLHPTQHRTFFNRLGGSVRGTKDEATRTARQAEVAALREHQKGRAAESMGALFSPAQGDTPTAPQEGGPTGIRGQAGLQGALESGQPVAVHHTDSNGDIHFRAVSPSNLKNYITSLPSDTSRVHVTHRMASNTSYNREPAHTTVLKRDRTGNWNEDVSQRMVHPAESVRPDAPFVQLGQEEAKRRGKAESEAVGKLGEATAAYEPPQLPMGLSNFLAGGGEKDVAQATHRQLMRKASRGDPLGQQYAAQFSQLASQHAEQVGNIQAASKGLLENLGRTAAFEKGRVIRTGAPAAVLPPEYHTEGAEGTEGMHIENAGQEGVGGPPSTLPKAQQGTIWAAGMTPQDHAIHDVLHLTGAVTRNDSLSLMRATPNMPEFDRSQVPEVGHSEQHGMVTADDQRTHAMNLGVRDAKFSPHVQGMLADIQGTADHPSEINGFQVHHYVSKVAAEAGVDTDEGRLDAIAENARTLQRQRHSEFKMGTGLGVSARSLAAMGGSPPGGVIRSRSHAQLQVEPESDHERFYREGLNRTNEAALAEYHHHLARSDQGFVQMSGEEAWQDAQAHAAARGGSHVPSSVERLPAAQGPLEKVERAPREPDEGMGPSEEEKHRAAQSKNIQGVRVKVGEDKALDAKADAILADPEGFKKRKAAAEAAGAASKGTAVEEAAKHQPQAQAAPQAETAETVQQPEPVKPKRGRRAA